MNAGAHPSIWGALIELFLGYSLPLLSWFSLSGISVPKILALLDQPVIFFVRSLSSQRHFLGAACLLCGC